MNSNGQTNLGTIAAPADGYETLVPEWIQKIGEHFGQGIAIFKPGSHIVFNNSVFIDHCDLPKAVWSQNNSFEAWLEYMAARGDLSGCDSKLTVQAILNKIAGDAFEEYTLPEVTPPNGKILEIKFVKTSGRFVSMFSNDVTDQRRSEETLDLAFEIAKSGYFYHVLESDHTTLRSAYLKRILTDEEYSAVEDGGFWSIIQSDRKDEIRENWKKSVHQGIELSQTVKIKTEKLGMIHLRISVRPVQTGAGKLNRVIGFFEDITDDYKIQCELRAAKDKSEEALKSKTHFLARISHEIRTPMNAVIGIADALIHHNRNPDIVPKLELIQSSAGNILNILDDTLHHSKLDTNEFTLDPKLGNPSKTIRNVCALWEMKARENKAYINCQIEDSVPDQIVFDNYRYEQCLNNLLSNAIKFSPGGTIDVISTRIDRNGSPNLIVAVKDTGIGMNADQRSRIFEPFQQGDEFITRRFGGTGLGLNITKNLIERMGGTISVKSEIDKGTIFLLSIPMQFEEVEVKTASELLFDSIMPDHSSNRVNNEPRTETPYERLKILVADDNPTNHMVVKSLLDGVVAEIYTANHGQEVMDIMEVQDIDIILMDIHMPVMDGIEATLAIRSSSKSWSDVLIIAVTADPQYQQQRLCLNIGMDFAVAKPIKLVDILEAFDHVLALIKPEISTKKIA